jgi:hypothetical protein
MLLTQEPSLPPRDGDAQERTVGGHNPFFHLGLWTRPSDRQSVFGLWNMARHAVPVPWRARGRMIYKVGSL